jgi:2-polyprenyl-3-methyl-5-hydroxy-6-metoxy-1,4-benzoquinol methylase
LSSFKGALQGLARAPFFKLLLMPISSFSIVSLIACELNFHKPKTVLDLGAGSGFYGAVIRQFVDMGWGKKTRIEGVEPFQQYKNPNWDHYSVMWRRSIHDHLEFVQNTKYDCILFLDVIEHLPRLQGLAMLEMLREFLNPGGVLIVSTPGLFQEQGAEYGNELERHVSFYAPEDFYTRGFIMLREGKLKDQFLQRMTVAKYVNPK